MLLDQTDELWQAELAVAQNEGAEVAAHRRHVERTKEIEDKIAVLYDAGKRGGEAEKYTTVQVSRQSAEIALLELLLDATQQERPALQARLKQLLAERRERQKALDATLAAYQADTVTLGDLLAAADNLCESELAAAKTPDERIAALKANVDRRRPLRRRSRRRLTRGAAVARPRNNTQCRPVCKRPKLDCSSSNWRPKCPSIGRRREAAQAVAGRRLKIAQTAREATLAAYQAETVTFADLLAATDNFWKAESAVAKTPGERIACTKTMSTGCGNTSS